MLFSPSLGTELVYTKSTSMKFVLPQYSDACRAFLPFTPIHTCLHWMIYLRMCPRIHGIHFCVFLCLGFDIHNSLPMSVRCCQRNARGCEVTFGEATSTMFLETIQPPFLSASFAGRISPSIEMDPFFTVPDLVLPRFFLPRVVLVSHWPDGCCGLGRTCDEA